MLAAFFLIQPARHVGAIAALPVDVAAKVLLSFGTYARQEEVSMVTLPHLLPPALTLLVAKALPWTLTCFPPEGTARCKTNDIDDTIPIGMANP